MPERKFSGSETASGPLMVRASSCDPFQVSAVRFSAIGPFCAFRWTSPRSPENEIGPFVVCASTLPAAIGDRDRSVDGTHLHAAVHAAHVDRSVLRLQIQTSIPRRVDDEDCQSIRRESVVGSVEGNPSRAYASRRCRAPSGPPRRASRPPRPCRSPPSNRRGPSRARGSCPRSGGVQLRGSAPRPC